jgi:hypothetical protein
MATQSLETQSHTRDLAPRPKPIPADRLDTTRQAAREVGRGGARILRRWSVTDLIARAGGAPRAFA